MEDFKELFDRYLTVVRVSNDIPDEMTIEEFLSKKWDFCDPSPCNMRVEVTWDGSYSLWSLRFDSTGRVNDERLWIRRDCAYEEAITQAIGQNMGGNVVEILTKVIPDIEMISGTGDDSEEFWIVWEWYSPIFTGKEDSGLQDGDWQEALL